jgi:hypothetical protein
MCPHAPATGFWMVLMQDATGGKKMSDPDPDLEVVTVFESNDPVAFNIAIATLQDAGIEFAAIEEALTGYGFSPIINPVCRIQVAEPFKDRAIELIHSLATPPDAEVTGDISPPD